ncbi:HTH domain protein [Atopobium sp. oral taxon 810 str. F0209]|nr:HTH domain protein [Atopobium sp. oral taxon 810 str. F0209]
MTYDMSFAGSALSHISFFWEVRNMNDNQSALLRELINAHGPLTSAQLANAIGVSSRTVKREIKPVTDILSHNGASLTSGNAGYRVKIIDRDAFSALKKRLSTKLSSPESNKQIVLIVSELLVNDYVTQDDLANDLFLSRSSVGKIMKNVRVLLEKHQILLSSRPHYGYYLIADESTIRNFIVAWLLADQNVTNLVSDVVLDRCSDYQEFLRVATRKLVDIALGNVVAGYGDAALFVESLAFM